MEDHKTAAERLPEHLAGRIDDLRTLADAARGRQTDELAEMTIGALRKLDDLGVALPDALETLAARDDADADEIASDVHLRAAGVDPSADEIPEDVDTLDIVLTDRDEDDLAESAREALQNYGLSLEVRTVVVWQFSTGGPGDQVEMDVSSGTYGYDVDGATYRFLDWFDGAARELSGADLDAVRDAAEVLGITEPGIVLPPLP